MELERKDIVECRCVDADGWWLEFDRATGKCNAVSDSLGGKAIPIDGKFLGEHQDFSRFLGISPESFDDLRKAVFGG